MPKPPYLKPAHMKAAKLCISLDRWLLDHLDALAQSRGKTRSGMIKALIRGWLEREGLIKPEEPLDLQRLPL